MTRRILLEGVKYKRRSPDPKPENNAPTIAKSMSRFDFLYEHRDAATTYTSHFTIDTGTDPADLNLW